MANAIFKEFRQYCPICDHTFTQLVVLHKVPEDYNCDRILADAAAHHDHKAFEEAKARGEIVNTGKQENTYKFGPIGG
jgi:hypothetical protein